MGKIYPESDHAQESKSAPESAEPESPETRMSNPGAAKPLDPRGWVSLVIPARNEELCIAEVIEKSLPFCDEIVVVDGHSIDRTVEIAESYGVRVVKDNKRGKGDAIARRL